jgi:hypothetical protein
MLVPFPLDPPRGFTAENTNNGTPDVFSRVNQSDYFLWSGRSHSAFDTGGDTICLGAQETKVWKDQLVLGSSLASNTASMRGMRPIVLSIHSFINIPNHLTVPSLHDPNPSRSPLHEGP